MAGAVRSLARGSTLRWLGLLVAVAIVSLQLHSCPKCTGPSASVGRPCVISRATAKEAVPMLPKDESPGDEVTLAPSSLPSAPQGTGGCAASEEAKALSYTQRAQRGGKLRAVHGTLKIIALSRLWPPPLHGTGGMQYHALHLYSQLAALGHDVHVIVTGGHRLKELHYSVDPESLQLQPVKSTVAKLHVYQVASSTDSEYSELWFENALQKARQLNGTVGGFQVAHSESWAGVPNAYQLGLPMAVTWHGSMLDWFRNDINNIVHNFRVKHQMPNENIVRRMRDLGPSVAYEAYMLLTVPHHIVISDSAASDLRQMNLVESQRIHLIYNGVNHANFHPDETGRAAFRKKHGIPSGSFVVGCGGRLEAIKGHQQLAIAMEEVLRGEPSVTLVVAGKGGQSHRYEALKGKGLNVMLLGMLPQSELAAFYQAIDVFIDPYYQHHGLNTVMIEAGLSGTPLIATALASSRTTVPCDDYGRTFDLGIPSDLAAQVHALRVNASLRMDIARNSRSRALALFTTQAMAGSYESVLYDAFLNREPLVPVTGKVVCKRAYPAMCYREPV